MTRQPLDLTAPLPTGRLVVEASAGTGKTYSLGALVVRHVAERGLTASSLLVVTFTRAAAAELRDRTRRALVAGVDALTSGTVPEEHPWMTALLDADPAERDRRRNHLVEAVTSFDDATITTIHGFCQQALRQLGLRSGTAIDSKVGDSTAELVDEVCRDLLVTALADDPTALSWPNKSPVMPGTVFTRLQETVTAVLGNPGSALLPDGPVTKLAKGDTPERLERWVRLVGDAVVEVGRRRAARRELGYDDLVTGLRDAVRHPVDGPAVVAALSSRYQLVLVDEFQDTDPVQWEIFEHAFSGDLITVGDPKQAIYRFRGADVHAYLAATRGQPTVELTTNYRSDADLVLATNSLVGGVPLGDAAIVAHAVGAAPNASLRAVTPGAPLVVRRVPNDSSLQTARGAFSAPLARRAILADLVRMVIDLFEHHTVDTGDGPVPVHPGHLAVLVPSRSTAEQTIRALARAGIPAVRTRTGSVFNTAASDEWSLFLSALERPSHPPTVRAAGLGAFLASDPAAVDPLADGADERLAALQQHCAGWAEELTERPFLAWYDRVRAESDLVGTLLARPGGERLLTDLDHVAELVAAELGGRGTTAAAARRCLDRLRAEATDEAGGADPKMRRIDSDAQAVQVTTLHSAKGLEYPIVLLPFAWQVPRPQGPWIYNEPNGRRVIDIATGQGWDDPDLDRSLGGRKHHNSVGARGDVLRLLYVGLTRAEHRTIVWWAPDSTSGKSALNTLLFDRDEAGEPLGTGSWLERDEKGKVRSSTPDIRVDDAAAQTALEVLACRSEGLIDVGVCDLDLPPLRWSPAVPSARSTLSVADADGRTLDDPTWRRWSFSSLSAGTVHDRMATAPTSPMAAASAAVPPERGGYDEPIDEQGPGQVGSQVTGPLSGQLAIAIESEMPWADVLAGASFGTLVHEVLERIDPTSPSLEDELRREVEVQLRRDGLDIDPAVIVTGLAASIRTPLGPIASGLRLADLPVRDRLAELSFDLPLVGTTGSFAATRIGAVLLDTLPADDPQRGYARQLARGRFGTHLAGYLQGSIDAVLRVPNGAGGHRYVVVDYKTNRLHERGAARPLAAYHPDRLPAAMAASDYPLQALLYSVAVHRYLRWRLPDYRPADHLGGAAYLFLRGMIGGGTPTDRGRPYGVFAWTPPAATVEALDHLLATGAVA